MVRYEALETKSGYNTAIAAAAREKITNISCDRFATFNYLYVSNRDVVDIRVRLDNSDIAGKVYEIPAGALYEIPAEENIEFASITQENLHAATAQTANKILFIARRVKVLNGA